jgi:hypothetical protein
METEIEGPRLKRAGGAPPAEIQGPIQAAFVPKRAEAPVP